MKGPGHRVGIYNRPSEDLYDASKDGCTKVNPKDLKREVVNAFGF